MPQGWARRRRPQFGGCAELLPFGLKRGGQFAVEEPLIGKNAEEPRGYKSDESKNDDGYGMPLLIPFHG